jgi:hypothetical protein
MFQSPRLMTCYQYRNLTNQSSGSLPRQSVLLDYQNLVLDHLVEIQMEATPIRHSTSPEKRSITTGRIAINVHLSREKKRTNDYDSKKNLEIKDQIMATTATKKMLLILLPLMRSRRFYQAKVHNHFPRPCGVVDLHLMDSQKQKLSWQILHQQQQSKTKEKRKTRISTWHQLVK